MDDLGMLDFKSIYYLSIGDMKWIPVKKISDSQDIICEGKNLTCFARCPNGDYWCFMREDGSSEPYVCFCEHTEFEAVYYAKSLSDAIFREIIHYCKSAYFGDKEYQINEQKLKQLLNQYLVCLNGILNEKQLEIITDLSHRSLTLQIYTQDEWLALLSEEEYNRIVNSTIHFPLIDTTFPIEWIND